MATFHALTSVGHYHQSRAERSDCYRRLPIAYIIDFTSRLDTLRTARGLQNLLIWVTCGSLPRGRNSRASKHYYGRVGVKHNSIISDWRTSPVQLWCWTSDKSRSVRLNWLPVLAYVLTASQIVCNTLKNMAMYHVITSHGSMECPALNSPGVLWNIEWVASCAWRCQLATCSWHMYPLHRRQHPIHMKQIISRRWIALISHTNPSTALPSALKILC